MRWREPSRLQVPLDGPLKRRRIHFVQDEVKDLDPLRGEVRTSSARFPYDALVLCPGADLDYAAVPGIDPKAGYVHSTFTIDEAVQARRSLAKVPASGSGRIAIGAAAGASCIGPAYELVMMIDTF